MMKKYEYDCVESNGTGPNNMTTFCLYMYMYVYVVEWAELLNFHAP